SIVDHAAWLGSMHPDAGRYSMFWAGKVARQVARRDAGVSCRRWGVATSSDKAWFTAADNGADGGNVAVADRRKCIALGAGAGRVDQNDVRRFAGAQQTAIEAVYAGITARRGGDGELRCHAGET